MSIKKSIVECKGCGKIFEKEDKYIKQSIKRNMSHFCSRSCLMHFNRRTNEKYCNNPPPINKSGKKKDEFSPFRYYLRKAKSRKKCNITLLDIKEQWESQNGMCGYTKIPMKLHGEHTNIFDLASLDRIDSSKPYIKGNIQFVICSLNYAKNDQNHIDFQNFILMIKNAS